MVFKVMPVPELVLSNVIGSDNLEPLTELSYFQILKRMPFANQVFVWMHIVLITHATGTYINAQIHTDMHTHAHTHKLKQ